LLNEDNSIHGYYSKFQIYPDIVSTNEILIVSISPEMHNFCLDYRIPIFLNLNNFTTINYIKICDANNPAYFEIFSRIIPNNFFFNINTLTIMNRSRSYTQQIICNDQKLNNFNNFCSKYRNRNKNYIRKNNNISIIPSGSIVNKDN